MILCNLLKSQTFYLCTRRGLCPALWTVCRCARWGSPRRFRDTGPLWACSSQLPAPLWSWRTLQTLSSQTSPPAWWAACRFPGSSASRCFPDRASTRRLCCQILAVEQGEKRNIIRTIGKHSLHRLGWALRCLFGCLRGCPQGHRVLRVAETCYINKLDWLIHRLFGATLVFGSIVCRQGTWL